MAVNANPPFEYDDDFLWLELYSRLTFQVRRWVYDSHLLNWWGQEDEIADDIVSESIKRVIEHLEDVNADRADPIVSRYNFTRKIARNYFIDLVRKDGRKVCFSQIVVDNEESVIGLIRAEMEDTSLNTVYFEHFFKIVAREVATFPKKQKEAMLRDHARRAIYMVDPTPLLRAYQSVGIQLTDYCNYVPLNNSERCRHSSLVYYGYQRLSRCPLVQQYISGFVRKTA